MDTRRNFFNKIYSYYHETIGKQIPHEYLNELSEEITDHYFNQYSRFRFQYPKSIKRYSTFRIDDLNHPDVYDIIIRYFKKKTNSNYPYYVTIILNMSFTELKEYEYQRQQYYNK